MNDFCFNEYNHNFIFNFEKFILFVNEIFDDVRSSFVMKEILYKASRNMIN